MDVLILSRTEGIKLRLKTNIWKIGTIALGAVVLAGFAMVAASKLGISESISFSNLPLFKPSEAQIEGEVFIVTKGGQNYKLGLVPITIRKLSDVKIATQERPVRQTEVLVETKTNADGKFFATLPYGQYEISASGSRYVIGKTEYYTWRVPLVVKQEKQSVLLSNDNLLYEPE